MNRKEFVKATGLVAAAFTLSGTQVFAKAEAVKVKLAIIGVGLRGQNHLDNILRRSDVDVAAICDIVRVQGTKGLWMDVNHSLYIEGVSKTNDSWEDAKAYLDKYDHPLWQWWSRETEGAGHGGMDFFVLHAFIESIKRKTPTPMDVYDAATWSAITPLSESSILAGNQTVAFPDFTGGKWAGRKNNFALSDEY